MSNNEKDIKWMYDGPKSIVNREDYLLGKKIDKNFELFSDVVVKEKEVEISERFSKKILDLQPSTSSGKTSVLDVGIVRTEDPLVAIKMQQEQRKRKLLENPLMKLKAQRILKEAYEKEIAKKKHKKNKHKRKRSSSPTSSSSDGRSKQKHKRHSSTQDSDSEERERSRKRRHHDERHKHGKNARENSSERLEKRSSLAQRPHSSTSRPKLTQAELEEKRKAMMNNVKWREEIRKETIEKAASKLRAEEEEMDNKTQTNCLKLPIGNVATASSSVEQRLQSKKHTLQRSHDYMEKSFAARK